MTDDFKPPIKSRSTSDLLAIVGAPKKWNERAVKLAYDELYSRKVDRSEIDLAKQRGKEQDAHAASKLASEKFRFYSFNPHKAFINWKDVIIFMFSWELEKEGRTGMAKFQRKYRPLVFLLIFILIILTILY